MIWGRKLLTRLEERDCGTARKQTTVGDNDRAERKRIEGAKSLQMAGTLRLNHRRSGLPKLGRCNRYSWVLGLAVLNHGDDRPRWRG